jgi:hypothetical protein
MAIYPVLQSFYKGMSKRSSRDWNLGQAGFTPFPAHHLYRWLDFRHCGVLDNWNLLILRSAIIIRIWSSLHEEMEISKGDDSNEA